MALRRCAKPVDGTIPIQALLYTDEELLTSQEGVGIYDGLQKSPQHQLGAVFATTHRLFYIDVREPESQSFAVDLANVVQTEYYAGLFTSSPKITLHLSQRRPNGDDSNDGHGMANVDVDLGDPQLGVWECSVCAYRNPPGRSPSAAQVCGLCGVPRSAMSIPHSTSPEVSLTSRGSLGPHQSDISRSLPSSSNATPRLTSTPSSSDDAPPGHGETKAVACPACTFLNHSSMRECEICGTKLPSPYLQMQSAPTTRSHTPDRYLDDEEEEDGSRAKIMKISFRKGGDKAFYTLLKRSLMGKAWESRSTQSSSGSSSQQNTIGITGILRTVESSAQNEDINLKNALQDLEALMIKAKDMVRLAADLNDKLTTAAAAAATGTAGTSASSGTASSRSQTPGYDTNVEALPEEATFIRSSLAQLGLQMTNGPVTADMVSDERKWMAELAKELAVVLNKMMMGTDGGVKGRGIIALDEVWGGWNRARGVALLPPSTFLQVLPLLPQHTSPPIQLRTFPSGLKVLHTPAYSQTCFISRLGGYLKEEGPKTTVEIALKEGLSVSLIGEMIEEVEANGGVVRDSRECEIVGRGGGLGMEVEVRWWINVFEGYSDVDQYP